MGPIESLDDISVDVDTSARSCTNLTSAVPVLCVVSEARLGCCEGKELDQYYQQDQLTKNIYMLTTWEGVKSQTGLRCDVNL